MKSLIFVFILILNVQAFAQVQSTSSKFHLLNMKCESVSDGLAEASPQSPPLDVDDPGTPGCNKWEINVLSSGDFARGEQHLDLPLLDINFGIGDNLQLKYEVPMEQNQIDGNTESNVGNSKYGIKYLFFEDEGSDTQLGFYPQVESGDGSIVTIPLLLSTKIGTVRTGDLMFSTNIGYNLSSKKDVQNSGFALAGIGMPILRRVSVMGELSAEEAVARGEDGVREELVKVNIGMVGAINKQFLLFGSLGESLISSDHLQHAYALAGFRVLTNTFGL
jgi:hypothetical protein